MKGLKILFFGVACFVSMGFLFAADADLSCDFYQSLNSKNNNPVQDKKYNYILLRFNKYDAILMEKMISEFSNYENKIAEISFDVKTHQLMIYYTSLITLDEILQVVSQYFTDFEKIGGTGL